MSIPKLVEAFYERIWNAGYLAAASDLLVEDFAFRGSLGVALKGRTAFLDYVRSVRTALAEYHCEVLTCVSEGEQAFAQMRFSGIHVAPFRGYTATGRPIHWMGAASFRFRDEAIAELWVLGDLAGLDSMLEQNQSTTALPALTEELALRLESLVAPEIPSVPNLDPAAPEIRRFGQTNASRGGRGAPADKVFCFGQAALSRLDEILEFYSSEGLQPTFYLTPMRFTPEVAAALSKRGFAQQEFQQAILYGVTVQSMVFPAGMSIERVSHATLPDSVRTTAEGFEWPQEWRDAAVEGIIESFSEDSYHFLAGFDGEPAGVASLVIREGVAQLEQGAVIPRWRRKGCHLALVQYRLKVAHELGCSLVMGGADFGSGSFRNQQRAGLRLAYIESGWRKA